MWQLSSLPTGHLYSQETSLVLISVRGWVHRPGPRIKSMKIPWLPLFTIFSSSITPSGIEPASFRHVAQCRDSTTWAKYKIRALNFYVCEISFHRLYLSSWNFPCLISGFRLEVAENCAILGHYAANSANLLPKFRDNLLVTSSVVKKPKAFWFFTPPPPPPPSIVCLETSVRN